jgi:hypothetical protein
MPRKPASTKPPEPEWLKDAPHKHLPILYNPDPNKDPEAFHKALAAIMETGNFSRIVFPSNIRFLESVTLKEGKIAPKSLEEQMTLQGDGKIWKTKHGFVWGEVLEWLKPNYWGIHDTINTFKGYTFSGDADFRWSTFRGDADFDSNTFIGSVYLISSTFIGSVDFSSSTFSRYAHFDSSTFIGDAHFDSNTFIGSAYFISNTFSGNTHFISSTFIGIANFSSSMFSGDADFSSSTFRGDAGFILSTFIGNANFSSSTFIGSVYFSSSTFSGDAGFILSTFIGNADFILSTFIGDANFSSSTFLNKVIFTQVNDERSFKAHITEIAQKIATYESQGNSNVAVILALKGHKQRLETPLPSFDFTHSIFTNAHFSTMRFLHSVTFDHAIFYERGDFSNALFPDKAIFESINSSVAYSQGQAYWENEVDTNGKSENTFHQRRATIQEKHDSTQKEQVKQNLAEALDKLNAIEKRVKDLLFKENPSTPELIFDNATFGDSATDRIEFRHITDTKLSFKAVNWGCVPRFIGVELSDTVLRDTDWRAPILQGVKWHKQDRRIKLTNGDEPEKLNVQLDRKWWNAKTIEDWQEWTRFRAKPKKEYIQQCANSEELYRQFKQNYEDRRDYGTAGEFHFSEKQMKQEKAYHEKDWAVWLPLCLYRVLSGYGERALRPLVWLALLTVLMPFMYLCTGLRIKDKDYLHFKHKLEQITLTKTCFSNNADTLSNCEHFQANTNFLARYPEAFEHSLKTILPFQEKFYVSMDTWGMFVSVLHYLLAPLLAVFFATALRQRVRR